MDVAAAKIVDKHGNHVDEHNETFCGSCYGAEDVRIFLLS